LGGGVRHLKSYAPKQRHEIIHSSTYLLGGKVDTVIQRTTLGNTSQSGHVVGSSVDREQPIDTWGNTLVNISGDDTIVIRGPVHTLEEGELGGVEWLSVVKALAGLNDNVGVANEDTVVVDFSRSSVVVGLRVGEETGLEVAELELDGEGLVGRDLAKVEWELEFGRGHAVLGENATLRDDVAGSRSDLLAISEGHTTRWVSSKFNKL
jgi:hypothetical protein